MSSGLSDPVERATVRSRKRFCPRLRSRGSSQEMASAPSVSTHSRPLSPSKTSTASLPGGGETPIFRMWSKSTGASSRRVAWRYPTKAWSVRSTTNTPPLSAASRDARSSARRGGLGRPRYASVEGRTTTTAQHTNAPAPTMAPRSPSTRRRPTATNPPDRITRGAEYLGCAGFDNPKTTMIMAIRAARTSPPASRLPFAAIVVRAPSAVRASQIVVTAGDARTRASPESKRLRSAVGSAPKCCVACSDHTYRTSARPPAATTNQVAPAATRIAAGATIAVQVFF